MEREDLQFQIVMDDGADTEVLARLAHLDMAAAAYMAAIARYPARNIQLRQGTRIIKRHDGEPEPPPPITPEPDPNLREFSAHLIRGRRMELLGYVDALDAAAATERAVALFTLTDDQRKRLAINPRR